MKLLTKKTSTVKRMLRSLLRVSRTSTPGALDGQRRVRRLPPPRGWYLPEVAQDRAELDSFDIIEGLALHGA
jgi:hypothetical protein